MTKITLRALKPMRYATRRLLPGDEFEVTSKDAKLLVALKRAEGLDRPLSEIPPIPESLARKIADIKSDAAPQQAVPAVPETQVATPENQAGNAPADLANDPDLAAPNTSGDDGEPPVDEETPAEDLATVRAQYKEIVGRAPYAGWTVEQLKEKIAEAQKAKS